MLEEFQPSGEAQSMGSREEWGAWTVALRAFRRMNEPTLVILQTHFHLFEVVGFKFGLG